MLLICVLVILVVHAALGFWFVWDRRRRRWLQIDEECRRARLVLSLPIEAATTVYAQTEERRAPEPRRPEPLPRRKRLELVRLDGVVRSGRVPVFGSEAVDYVAVVPGDVPGAVPGAVPGDVPGDVPGASTESGERKRR